MEGVGSHKFCMRRSGYFLLCTSRLLDVRISADACDKHRYNLVDNHSKDKAPCGKGAKNSVTERYREQRRILRVESVTTRKGSEVF